MEIMVVNHKQYTITAKTEVQKGIFFRSPIQKVFYSNEFLTDFSSLDYMNKIKNPVRKLFELLLGNRKILKNIKEWSTEDDWVGFMANHLCSPIYFSRQYRKTTVLSNDNKTNFQKVLSYGYSDEFKFVAGDCNIEKTIITLRNGKRIKLKNKEQYQFTYVHILENMLDSGKIPN